MARAALILALLASAIAVAASQTVEPTPAPVEPCPTGGGDKDEAQYRSPTGCKRCRSRSSPFFQSYGGFTCVPPTTLSAFSTVCTNAVHSAFILSNIPPRDTLVGCINPNKQTVRVVMPIRNSDYPFMNAKSFIGGSIFLDGTIPRNGRGNGRLVQIGGIPRVYFSFTAPSTRRFKRKSGQVVQITGAWRRGGNLLNECFVAYLSICG